MIWGIIRVAICSNTQKVHPEMRWTDIADCANPIYNFLLPDFEKVGISPWTYTFDCENSQPIDRKGFFCQATY